jgi:hypothetical protein
MNAADFDLLKKQVDTEKLIKELFAELERVVIDNHLLRQEVERLTLKLKPGQETLR